MCNPTKCPSVARWNDCVLTTAVQTEHVTAAGMVTGTEGLNTGWKGALGSPCPGSAPAGTTAHSFSLCFLCSSHAARELSGPWTHRARSALPARPRQLSCSCCTTYCASPLVQQSLILKTELDSKTNFFGLHLNDLSYPLKSCPIFPSLSLLCLWKSFLIFILTSGKGSFWVWHLWDIWGVVGMWSVWCLCCFP